MATNTGKGYRKGSVKDESQTQNPVTENWTKRGEDGKFKDVKSDDKPFKGVAKEPDGRKKSE